jgi:hypothetical protein
MSPLYALGDLLRSAMLAVPMAAVRALFVASLVALLVWVWRLPKSATVPPGGARRWDEDLRIWASLALVIQIAIYSWF